RAPGHLASAPALSDRRLQQQRMVSGNPMERIPLFDFRRRSPTLLRWGLRAALTVAAVSALALLALLVWSTGNASRYAQQYDLLLALTGIFAMALGFWVLVLAARLVRQIRRRQFGARLTSRLALSFVLIGVL